jgi:hypothetical protein
MLQRRGGGDAAGGGGRADGRGGGGARHQAAADGAPGGGAAPGPCTGLDPATYLGERLGPGARAPNIYSTSSAAIDFTTGRRPPAVTVALMQGDYAYHLYWRFSRYIA